MFLISCMHDLRTVRSIGRLALLCACGIATANAAESAPGGGPAGRQDVTPVMVAGTAIADYWAATPAEYAATAESILDAVGAPSVRRGTVTSSIAVELLTMLGGGGGAPQDVVKARPLVQSPSVQ
ncbi:MAG: hypothetical protein WC809_12425 [Sinimarinibacterium sp.]|jgi:hypothetical protein